MINIANIKKAKKKFRNKWNVMAAWFCYAIWLVITFNDIPLSPLILFINYFVPNGSLFQCIKSHLSICWEWTLFYCIAETYQLVILLQFQYLLANILFVGMWRFLIRSYWGFRSPFKALQLQANDWVIL